ncbi:hypothetical protein [Allosphingosinicella sp.]|uniref:hypothetical protein n=1 Tax=Allosphingosinicella sp. TaxID=2823234 RepID=UPI002FC0ACAF
MTNRKGSGIASEEELGAALGHIEAALLAFSGNAGHMAAAIAELDRLRVRAQRSGVPMEQWLEAVADDIRAAAPSVDVVALEHVLTLAKRIAEDPRRSLGAQAHLAGGAVRTLTG